MMLHARTALVILILLAFPAQTLAVPVSPLASEDDAASGGDAPDLPSPTIPVVSGRTYHGAFVRTDDLWDWFRLEGGLGDVVHVQLHADAACLRVEHDGLRLGSACATRVRPASVWVEVGDAAALDVGVEKVSLEAYKLAAGVDRFAPTTDGSAPGSGPVLVVDDDAGSGRDAPGVPTPLVPVRPSAGYVGQAGHGRGDFQDWYVVDAPAGTHLRLEATWNGLACFALVPEKDARADAPCHLQPFDAPIVAEEVLDGDGLWYVRVAALEGPYRIGLTAVAPDA